MDYYVYPFASLDNTNLTSLLNEEQHNCPLHIIDTMMYNTFNYHENNVLNNFPVQLNSYEPDCKYYFCDERVPVIGEFNPCLNLFALKICNLPRHLVPVLTSALMYFV